MLKLKEEFSDLFGFFDLDEEARAEKFQETINQTVRFSEKVKEKIANGTQEEKEELQDLLEEMQEKIEQEKTQLFEKIGISEEDLSNFLSDKNNFSEEEWRAMQEMKSYVAENQPQPKVPVKKVKKHKKSKTQWIQS